LGKLTNDLRNIKELEFKPGSGYLYTNYSPLILERIIEKISGQNFTDYVEQHLLIPFNLKSTLIKGQYPYKDETLMAIPFNSDFEEDNYKLNVSGMLFSSTAQDLSNWLEQLSTFKIIDENSLKFLSQTVKEGDEFESPLGSGKWHENELIEHSHHGSIANYEGVVRNFKKEDLNIIILSTYAKIFDTFSFLKLIVYSNPKWLIIFSSSSTSCN